MKYSCATCHPEVQHPDVDWCDSCKGKETATDNAIGIVYTVHWNELIEALNGMVQAMDKDLHELMLAKLKAIEVLNKVKEKE